MATLMEEVFIVNAVLHDSRGSSYKSARRVSCLCVSYCDSDRRAK